MPYLDKHPTSPFAERDSGDWFASRRKRELIDTIIEMRNRFPTDTLRINHEKVREAQAHQPQPSDANGAGSPYVRLPLHPAHWHESLVGDPWRLEVTSSNPTHPTLYLEIGGDVFLGRSFSGIEPDLDLSVFDGAELGVSRQHALLRPHEGSLYLVDLESTNGTRISHKILKSGVPYALEDGDTISLANLHLSLTFLRVPGQFS